MIISKASIAESKTWESLGSIIQGGTVYSVAVSPVEQVARCWAATGCGVFFSDDNGAHWIQSLSGLTTPLLAAIAVSSRGALIAGSLQGDLFMSFDYGESWTTGVVPAESKCTITGLAISPNYHQDGCAFAATDGAGLLVTRNSGRIWEDSSFGLSSNTVLAVVTTPDWSHREMMFAATLDGVFVSHNGGRAWRETELLLSDDVVDALVVSPAFDKDHTVFAGTENGCVYCSTDSGRTWEMAAECIADGPVNCLWLAPDFANSGRVLAGVSSEIYQSEDKGATWKLTSQNNGAVLALAGSERVILAGLQDGGAISSLDGGATWQPSSESLAARGFASLAAAGSTLVTFGPQEGVMVSSNGGEAWTKLPGLEPYLPLTTLFLVSADELLVASQTHGILRTRSRGERWDLVCSVEGLRVISIAGNGSGLAGTADGLLYMTQDGGETWSATESPCKGQEILAIAFSPSYGVDHTILMGTAIPASTSQQARVALWRTTNGGANWRQVTTQVTTARWLEIALPVGVEQKAVEQAVLATGPFCLRPLRRAKDVWISTRVDPSGTNALSVISIGEIDSGGTLYVATGNGVFRSIDGGRTWHAFLQPDEAQSFISLALAQNDGLILYALSLGGRLYKHQIA